MKWLMMSSVFVMGAFGAAGSLAVLNDPMLFGGGDNKAPATRMPTTNPGVSAAYQLKPGQVEVLLLTRDKGIFEVLGPDDFIDPVTRLTSKYPTDRERAEKLGYITFANVNEYYGRVVSRDIRAGQIMSTTSFFPVGTRPGVSAGIPADKRGYFLDVAANKNITGFEGMRTGDTFDLIVTDTVDFDAPKVPVGDKVTTLGVSRSRLGIQNTIPASRKDTVEPEVRVVATKAVFVSRISREGELLNKMVLERLPPLTNVQNGRARSGGTNARNRAASRVSAPSKPEPYLLEGVFIAVDPREMPLIADAVSRGKPIHAAVRSSLPTDTGTSTVPDIIPTPPPPIQVRPFEIRKGTQRAIEIFRVQDVGG